MPAGMLLPMGAPPPSIDILFCAERGPKVERPSSVPRIFFFWLARNQTYSFPRMSYENKVLDVLFVFQKIENVIEKRLSWTVDIQCLYALCTFKFAGGV